MSVGVNITLIHAGIKISQYFGWVKLSQKFNGTEDNYSFRVVSEPPVPSGLRLDISYEVDFQDQNPLK